MAIYHMSAKIIKRSGGGKAVASAAYRSGEKIKDFANGETYDYTRKSGVIYTEIITPEDAPEWSKNRESLWNAAEAIEKRKDAQVAREIEVAIPVELDREQQIELVREYASKTFVSDGMAADVCIHDKGDGNPHAHIMLTMREVTPEGFGGKDKRSKNQTVWNKPQTLVKWREAWEAETNASLERAGQEQRIDSRTLTAQGIEREPQIHVGPRGNTIKGERWEYNEEIKRLNGERAAGLKEAARCEARLEELKMEVAEAIVTSDLNMTEINALLAGKDIPAPEPAAATTPPISVKAPVKEEVIQEGRAEARAMYEERKQERAESAAARDFAPKPEPPKPQKSLEELEKGLEELVERRAEYEKILDAAAEEIAGPEIERARESFIDELAKAIQAENQKLYDEVSQISDELNKHDTQEPHQPWFIGVGQWKRDWGSWNRQRDVMRERLKKRWKEAGGEVIEKDGNMEFRGNEKAVERLTPEWARRKAKEEADNDPGLKKITEEINYRAIKQTRNDNDRIVDAIWMIIAKLPERQREVAVARRDARIVELDKKVANNSGYSVGSAGGSLARKAAAEVLELETARQDGDAEKAQKLHPKAVSVLRRAEQKRERERERGFSR